ncbi:hypothetical protein A1O3_03913 [Capronia epimyces CBS 606.96]|uniref:Selenoprotein W-like protein n=1 Tax=Capronia epimyces CBS 606.96 TaxID=1182542 RepID=W9YXE0_9EURO|nr:uncharacterized protein A1O3_03913 [Capronia epimyces CBS 606.96]EXJ86959.1 hypothetical protein A1O3_03913 [Capronia epimyces CBS 606.96]
MTTQASSTVHVPRVAIRFCTQCKWNLRAAYYAQELLQTFGTGIGEVALIPATGGIFTVIMTHAVSQSAGPSGIEAEAGSKPVTVTETVLWDRKVDGGFPETKELKNRVRNIVDPDRDLGHIDRSLKKKDQGVDGEPRTKAQQQPDIVHQPTGQSGKQEETKDCEDCK